MIHQTIQLPVHYAGRLDNNDFKPYLTTYLLDNYADLDPARKRPLVLICPGGGYSHLSVRESEAVAIKMNALGFQAVILHYSVAPMDFPVAACDLAEAIYYARHHADDWHIHADRIILCGFSAGAHLCATLGCFWNTSLLSDYLPYKNADIEPNALLLCYPVITAQKAFCHEDSVQHVLGKSSPTDADRNLVSLENHVTEDMPPVFMWHTVADEAVPAENSLLFARALRRAGVPFEYHLFNRGRHGLGLATAETSKPDGRTVEEECAVWPELFAAWLKGMQADL